TQMLARWWAAGCGLALFAVCLATWLTLGREAAHTALTIGSYALLAVAVVSFLAAEAHRVRQKPPPRAVPSLTGRTSHVAAAEAPDAMPGHPPAASTDDLVGMLDNTLKLAGTAPAGGPEPI